MAANFFMLLAAIILGTGHIGIHLSHKKEILSNKPKRGGDFSDYPYCFDSPFGDNFWFTYSNHRRQKH